MIYFVTARLGRKEVVMVLKDLLRRSQELTLSSQDLPDNVGHFLRREDLGPSRAIGAPTQLLPFSINGCVKAFTGGGD